MVQRARSGLEVLDSHPQVNGELAAVGYCFGGLAVLQLARAGVDIRAAISVHGSLTTSTPAGRGEIKARVLVCHGAIDPFVPPAQVHEFVREMNAAEADWQMVIYGGVTHGFTHRTGAPTSGVAYDELADRRSFTAITHFLAEAFDQELRGAEL